jgi:hypothetical protein
VSETPGMAQHEVTRTLVKSQPEVWTQCSDADSLGRHLSGSFGEIRITRLEPEHSVAWEGEEISGTVRIEPSAWGTRVTLTAELADEVADLEQAAPPRESEPAPEPEPEPEPEAVSKPQPEVAPETAPPTEGAADPLPTAQVLSPEIAATPAFWTRVRAWFSRMSAVEPPAEVSEELPVAEELPVSEELPVAEELPVTEEPVKPEELTLVEAPAVEEPVAQEPEVPAVPEPEPAAEAAPRQDTEAVLAAALESLGQAHHRPFSRA